jgi:hypothetical protein
VCAELDVVGVAGGEEGEDEEEEVEERHHVGLCEC